MAAGDCQFTPVEQLQEIFYRDSVILYTHKEKRYVF